MFTVVIPLYNKASIIVRTLASVLTQTFTDFEVIVVDDGSTDNGVQLIRQFTSDPRIRIVHQENQGVSVARNRGVALAAHPYIAFLDADDEWLPGYLQKMHEAITLFPNAALLGCASWHRDILSGEMGNSLLNRYKGKIQRADYFENPQAMPHTSAMVANKQFFELIEHGNGFPPGMKCCEDWCCFNRLGFLGDFVYVGFTLGIKNNNVSEQITGLGKAEHFKLLPYVVQFYNTTHAFSTICHQDSYRYVLFKIFFKYDLRNRIICALREHDYATINFLFNGLTNPCINELHDFEIYLYKTPAFNLLAQACIYFTKLRWRSHGFPIVGKAD